MKINDMDKFELTKNIKKAKEIIQNPNIGIFDLDKEIANEIINPERDQDGYVHKYYLKEETKEVIKILLEK